ncbi:YhjD/YihY/BrkB family envelope integrity protein [Calidifontibacter terrae]
MTVLHDEVIDRPFDDAPDSPAKPDWKVAFGRARAKFSQDGGTDMAAALTYFSVQSLFPGLIAVISLLNIFGNGKSTTTSLVKSVGNIVGKKPEDLSAITSFINNVQATPGGGVALFLGLAGALWSASGYVGAFGRAVNKIYAVEEGRGFVKLKGSLLLITAIEIVLIVLVMLSLVLSGSVAKEIGSKIGLGGTAVQVWDLAKWPFVALVIIGIISMLYQLTPNVRRAKNKLFSSGAMVGFVIWVVASIALVVYVGFTKGASYQKTYGALAGVIIFLLWLWITNIAMLFGAELDAELLRTRQLKSGLPAERLILLPARDDTGIEKKADKDETQVERAIELRVGSTPATDALTRSSSGSHDTAREFGLAVGPSAHGRTGNGSAPVTREPSQLGSTTPASTTGSAGSTGDVQVDVAQARAQRRDQALIAAEAQRKAAARRAAQQAKIAKRQAAKEKERAAQEKAREQAITVQQRWEAADAVRAQYRPASTDAREALLAERSQRREAFHQAQQEKAARPAPKHAPKPAKKKADPTEGDGSTRAARMDSRPLRRLVESERDQRRDQWYSDHGL